ISRANFSICGSIASAAAIRRGISTNPWTSLASSGSDNSPRALPAAIAIAASTINWQVKALVEATPTSGPASGGRTVSLSRAIVGLVDQRGRGGVLDGVPMHNSVVLVVKSRAPSRQNNPVAVLEITDAVGKRAKRDRIRAEVHFTVAISNREWRPVARTDHQIVVAREDEPKRECAAQLRQCRLDRIDRLQSLPQ